MRISPLAYMLLAPVLPLGAQESAGEPTPEPAYFSEQAPPWWVPKGELLLTAERIPAVPYPDDPRTDRTRALLELGWRARLGPGFGEFAFRSSIGSDGNALNGPRYDQTPSNGTWMQRASLTLPLTKEHGFGEVTLGLQGNPLLSQESLWDHDLAILGVGARLAYRHEDAGLQEAGLRAVSGRVRTFPGSAVDLTAVQGVVRFEVGTWTWTAHAGRWELRWEVGRNRERAALYPPEAGPQYLRLDEVGLGVQSIGPWPWELRGIQHRNPATGDTGGEFQAWLGARTRPWHPQVGYIWQRFAYTGTFMPVNGDEWWFTRGARGPKYLFVLPLPGQWRLTLSHLSQKGDYYDEPVKRTALSLLWPF